MHSREKGKRKRNEEDKEAWKQGDWPEVEMHINGNM